MKTLGEIIKNRRLELGLSQIELSKIAENVQKNKKNDINENYKMLNEDITDRTPILDLLDTNI